MNFTCLKVGMYIAFISFTTLWHFPAVSMPCIFKLLIYLSSDKFWPIYGQPKPFLSSICRRYHVMGFHCFPYFSTLTDCDGDNYAQYTIPKPDQMPAFGLGLVLTLLLIRWGLEAVLYASVIHQIWSINWTLCRSAGSKSNVAVSGRKDDLLVSFLKHQVKEGVHSWTEEGVHIASSKLNWWRSNEQINQTNKERHENISGCWSGPLAALIAPVISLLLEWFHLPSWMNNRETK